MKLYHWQTELIEKLAAAKPGELKIMMANRNVGKSIVNSQLAFNRLMRDLHKPQPISELKLSEGRVHGAKYHCVEPVGGIWKDMESWCREKFGEPGDMWSTHDFVWPETARWMQNNSKFWFRHEADRTMFILKWS